VQTRPYRNQAFLGSLRFRKRVVQNQEFADAISGRFLGKPRTARCAVPLDIPNVWQISVHERPSFRRPATFMRSTTWHKILDTATPAVSQLYWKKSVACSTRMRQRFWLLTPDS